MQTSLLALCMYASLICATLFHCYASLRLNFYSAYLKWRAFSGRMVEDVYVQFNLEVHTCQCVLVSFFPYVHILQQTHMMPCSQLYLEWFSLQYDIPSGLVMHLVCMVYVCMHSPVCFLLFRDLWSMS